MMYFLVHEQGDWRECSRLDSARRGASALQIVRDAYFRYVPKRMDSLHTGLAVHNERPSVRACQHSSAYTWYDCLHGHLQ